jgi:hypothetical protein
MRPVTVAALHFDNSGRPLQVLSEVDLMIEFDGTRIAVAGPQDEEFRVPAGKRFDARRNSQLPAFRFQIAVASDACRVARIGKQLRRAGVFDMAIHAFGCGRLLIAMHRAIVTLKARLVGDAGVLAGALDMARGAVLLKRGVVRIERAAGECRLIPCKKGPPSNPAHAYDDSDQCEADTPAWNREFVLKIVPFDPLCAAFGIS